MSATVILAAVALTLGGCGASAQAEVKAKLQQFARASARKDYRTICTQVFASSLVTHLSANGIRCEEALQIALGSVQNPSLAIGRVTVKGHRATAIALSMASNQQSSVDAIDLVQTDGGWRISALSSRLS